VLTRAQFGDVAPDVAASLGVQAYVRLIQEQHLVRVHQPARDLESALHPARERLHEVVATMGQLDHLEHLIEGPGIRECGTR
jgi:hypothetical protein